MKRTHIQNLVYLLGFIVIFAGKAEEPKPLTSVSGIGELVSNESSNQEAMAVPVEDSRRACETCSLLDLIRQPELFFESLRWPSEESSAVLSVLEESQEKALAIKFFGGYSTDLKDGDYILTINVKQPMDSPDMKRLEIRDSLDNTQDRISKWDGLASFRIAQLNSHEVFLKGRVESRVARAEHPLEMGQEFLSVDIFNDADMGFKSIEGQEYLTYAMGIRIERGPGGFLDVSTFKTNINRDSPAFYNSARFLDFKQLEGLKGVDVKVGSLMDYWEGGIRYTYTDQEAYGTQDTSYVRHSGSLRLGYFPTVNLAIGGIWTKKGEELFNSEKSMDVLDIYSFYNVNEKARLGVILQNITDESYVDYINPAEDSLFKQNERTLWLRFEFQH